MEIKKHIIRSEDYSLAIRISQIAGIFWMSDNTVKFRLVGGESTGWLRCSRLEYENLLDAWERYLDKLITLSDEVIKNVR